MKSGWWGLIEVLELGRKAPVHAHDFPQAESLQLRGGYMDLGQRSPICVKTAQLRLRLIDQGTNWQAIKYLAQSRSHSSKEKENSSRQSKGLAPLSTARRRNSSKA